MSLTFPKWVIQCLLGFFPLQNGFCYNIMCRNDYCLILTHSVFLKTGLFWKETCKEKNTVAHRYCYKSGIYCAVCPTNAQLYLVFPKPIKSAGSLQHWKSYNNQKSVLASWLLILLWVHRNLLRKSSTLPWIASVSNKSYLKVNIWRACLV